MQDTVSPGKGDIVMEMVLSFLQEYGWAGFLFLFLLALLRCVKYIPQCIKYITAYLGEKLRAEIMKTAINNGYEEGQLDNGKVIYRKRVPQEAETQTPHDQNGSDIIDFDKAKTKESSTKHVGGGHK